jgi:hypothetical protein
LPPFAEEIARRVAAKKEAKVAPIGGATNTSSNADQNAGVAATSRNKKSRSSFLDRLNIS